MDILGDIGTNPPEHLVFTKGLVVLQKHHKPNQRNDPNPAGYKPILQRRG